MIFFEINDQNNAFNDLLKRIKYVENIVQVRCCSTVNGVAGLFSFLLTRFLNVKAFHEYIQDNEHMMSSNSMPKKLSNITFFLLSINWIYTAFHLTK
jgi:hypothetical protein